MSSPVAVTWRGSFTAGAKFQQQEESSWAEEEQTAAAERIRDDEPFL